MSYLERSRKLIGKENLDLIQEKTICVFGLGGVGGSAFIALVRSGFKKFIIVDFDIVSESNLNRQLIYLNKDLGRKKIEVAKEYALAISQDIEIVALDMRVGDDLDVLKDMHIDYIVDAIDDVKGKKTIAKLALNHQIPLIMSLGMANRLDPTKVRTINLNKTTDDPLARKIRYEFKKDGIDTKQIMTVCSTETPVKKDILSSMVMVPSQAGLVITYEIIKHFIERN